MRLLRSLPARIALIVFVSATPGFILTFVVASNERRDGKVQAETETELVVATAAGGYTAVLDQTRLLFSTFENLPTTAIGATVCSVQLRRLVERTDAYDDLIVALPDGNVVCSGRTDTPENVAGLSWFRRATELDGFALTADRSLYGTHSIRSPSGILRAVVAVDFSFAGLDDAFQRDGVPKGSNLVLLGPDDVVLYRAPIETGVGMVANAPIITEIRRRDATGAVASTGTDGIRRIYAFRPVEPEGTVLYAGIPVDVAYGDAGTRFNLRILGLAIATAAALGVGFFLAYLAIARRLRRLAQVTTEIGRGNLDARSQMEPDDEIGVLGHTIDTMASELAAREEERQHLLAAVVRAGERERMRIASDVHDDSIQIMSAHVMGLQMLQRTTTDPDVLERARDLEQSGRAAIIRLRDLVFELHSPALEELGLVPAIDVLLARTFEGTNVHTVIHAKLANDPSPAIRDTAYRIAQEAVSNARTHAHALEVRVSVEHTDDELRLRIVDNGDGFDPNNATARPGHLGLAAAAERAAAVGGLLDVTSSPGQGTTVDARLPWSLAVADVDLTFVHAPLPEPAAGS